MRPSILTTFVVLALSFTNASIIRRESSEFETSDPAAVEADLAQTAYENLSVQLEETESSLTEKRAVKCTLGNVRIRREWYSDPIYL